MKIGFHGGVGEVTGSRHLLEAEGLKILLDCGLFQGHRKEAIAKNRETPFDPKTVDVVLLSHAHVDHCGSLPLLVKRGFKGPIHCTEATKDITAIMLLDSAHLQENDADFFNKMHARDGNPERIAPLYNTEDAKAAIALLRTHPYETWIPLNDKVRFRFHNAGHVLGSAMIRVETKTAKGTRNVLFTGDLGRRKTILMEPPKVSNPVDYLLIESTYGDRLHDPVDRVEAIMKEVIERTIAEKGKIVIPSFALERTQELVFVLEKMMRRKQVPKLPIIVDSPMAVSITEIFDRHASGFSFSPEFRDYVAREGSPFDFESVRYSRTVEDSQKLNSAEGPMIILSASGMCEGGRVLHHLRNNIGKDTTTILLVGYQAQGTLGRRLQEGAKKVKIFGLEHEVWARVQTLHTFSAHADRDDLLWFMKAHAPRPRTIFLVHGDPKDRLALKEHLHAEGIDRVECPEYGQEFQLE
ncbi:MAG: MBL fold metallo-hydrolase [Elusimicrobia bacterium]|nr:MBL fold metallo-hydrolase [Elusimicrobiota bacterium]